MDEIQDLLDRYRTWAERLEQDDPGFFSRLAKGQAPAYFWIGCADSRVPATQATGLQLGDLFVHRSVANVVTHSDPNCMSALQYSVLNLRVRHVIVCGHYGCGGVQGAMQGGIGGAVGDWLKPIEDIVEAHKDELDMLDENAAFRRLCELNVLRSVQAVVSSDTAATAWQQGQPLSVHSWIYDLEDGSLNILQEPISAPA